MPIGRTIPLRNEWRPGKPCAVITPTKLVRLPPTNAAYLNAPSRASSEAIVSASTALLRLRSSTRPPTYPIAVEAAIRSANHHFAYA